MTVGTLVVRFVLRESHSLKDKRQVIRSLKERLFNKFRVSVAEVDHQDEWQQATLGIAVVGTDRRFVDSVLAKVVDVLHYVPGAELVDYETEIW